MWTFLILAFYVQQQNLSNSKVRGINEFQIKPIKYVTDLLASALTHIFNLILRTGIFREKMQAAKVAVLHKGGDVNNLGNYKSISILPPFSKGIEK